MKIGTVKTIFCKGRKVMPWVLSKNASARINIGPKVHYDHDFLPDLLNDSKLKNKANIIWENIFCQKWDTMKLT